jgi:hypothetical protein
MFSRLLHPTHDRRHSFQKIQTGFSQTFIILKTKQMMYNFIDKLYNFSFSRKIKKFLGVKSMKSESLPIS